MELIAGSGSFLIGTIVPFLFVLTIVVFFHELGHFAVARWCGVGVRTFSVGFGPEILGTTDKHGTRWKLSAIPLGGYVKFAGDENVASVPDNAELAQMNEQERQKAFHLKPLWQRAAVVVAGPLANFILAIVIFAGVFMTLGETVTVPRIDTVQENSAAEAAGVEAGDIVVAIEGNAIETFADVQRVVTLSAERPLLFTLDRAGTLLDLTIVPERREIDDGFGNRQRVGVIGVVHEADEDDVTVIEYGPLAATGRAVEQTGLVITQSLTYIGRILVGQESPDQLSGPVRVAKISGDVATLGFLALLQLTAVISVSIGMVNLFPIPMLDGGHLAFYAAEAIRGKPLSDRSQEIGFRIGLAMVMFLMVFATWNDIVNLMR
ncbi:MAG: RIP metalloprotease RseP [Rhizobiales bacterium]|nr:RIP metalloprotease RseP [Hyphomicrobiales bacterium]MBO6698162.1 RIP metalloprotease RseP [Hyphomicrobiales bacterium]MBO6735584.1 RIP metalloprotease RseP [Hyphomicrobiales bacterium]MBO6910608.1 RIP metalloprotease RseP [Hyphomicrobiales bacterium]MBO6956721.1 RIP metalloprotease RseP [Hyphomicrobiales bacterium]